MPTSGRRRRLRLRRLGDGRAARKSGSSRGFASPGVASERDSPDRRRKYGTTGGSCRGSGVRARRAFVRIDTIAASLPKRDFRSHPPCFALVTGRTGHAAAPSPSRNTFQLISLRQIADAAKEQTTGRISPCSRSLAGKREGGRRLNRREFPSSREGGEARRLWG